jgi:hypothetical protein
VVGTTITITSQTGSAALAPHHVPMLPWLGGSGVMAAFCIFLVPARRYRNRLAMLFALAFVTLLPIVGCGTSGNSHITVTQPPINTPSPNAGTYTATVTATSS